MTDYNIQDFKELNAYAAQVVEQNERYARVAKLSNPDSARNAMNRIAKEQSAHIQLVGELGADLPYGEIDEELELVVKELTDIAIGEMDPMATTKIGAMALADRLSAECYTHLADTIELNIDKRLKELDAKGRQINQVRVEELQGRLRYLSEISDIIARPWPVPRAQILEDPEPRLPQSTNGYGAPVENFEAPQNPLFSVRPDSGGRVGRSWEVRGGVRRGASKIIVEHIATHPDETITAEEIAELLYRDFGFDNMSDRKVRNRVVSLIWQDASNGSISQGLAEHGLRLDRGKAAYVLIGSDGSLEKTGSSKIVWRGTTIEKANGAPREFTDILFFDSVTGQRAGNPGSTSIS